MKNVLAANIRRLRKSKKLSQNALAERAEISFRGLQEIEYENAWPEWETVMALAEALDVSDAELFQDPDIRPPISPEIALSVVAEAIKKSSPPLSLVELDLPKDPKLVELIGLLKSHPGAINGTLRRARNLAKRDESKPPGESGA